MVRIPIPITNDPVEFDGFCPFPIEYQDLRGAVFQVLTFDADGNLTRIEIFSPGLTSEVSANGKSVVFNDAGPITVIPQADGSDLVMLRGNSFEFDQGLLSGQPIAQVGCRHVDLRSGDRLQRLHEHRRGRSDGGPVCAARLILTA